MGKKKKRDPDDSQTINLNCSVSGVGLIQVD